MEQIETGTSVPEKKVIKRKGTMGWIAFLAVFLSICVLLYVGLSSVSAYLEHNIGADLLDKITLGAVVAVALAATSVLIALVTFFIKKQKKGLAVFSMILALLIVFLAGVVLYFYNYMFGTMDYDTEFKEVQEELIIVEPDAEGMIDLETEPEVIEVLEEEEVKEQLQLQELDWEYLLDEDVPEEGLAMMNSKTPTGPGYLHPDAAQIENYLLFGLDKVGSSDTVIVLSFDRVHKKVKLISLARDSYVKIPEWGSYTKLTYAYSAGQEKTAVSTVNYNYRLNVKDYITVRMDEIEQIVDLLGGVEVRLDYDELEYMNFYGHYGLSYGLNFLDGAAAVTYSRMRSSSRNDSEAKRTGRQREVLTSMFEKAKTIPTSTYPTLIRAGMELCKTSFESNEILGIMMEAVLQGYSLESYALIDMVEYWADKFGPRNYVYFVYDLDGAADTLYKVIYEDLYVSGYPDPEPETDPVE